ncbi:MAG: methyltransferase domain-containing protein [Saprospiraceae bacterium]|nr:methyltransferase domain-containing protein [Saprospiraceae bacterium]
MPKWKIWLSYLFEQTIEHTGSNQNPSLSLCLSRGRLQLYTPNAIYSFEDLYDNFFDLFQKIDFERHAIKEVLVLGFGLGSVPYMLENNFALSARYTGVESDGEVLRLASSYAVPKLNSSCTIVQADAFAFVEQSREKFDLIVVDLFLDNVIPSQFNEPFFLDNCKDLLVPDGLLVFNRLSSTPEKKELTREYYEEVFKSIFEKGRLVEIKDNSLLISHSRFLK